MNPKTVPLPNPTSARARGVRRWGVAVALAAVACVPRPTRVPALARPPLPPPPAVTAHVLSNGLHVIIAERPRLPIIAAQLVTRRGPTDVQLPEAGLPALAVWLAANRRADGGLSPLGTSAGAAVTVQPDYLAFRFVCTSEQFVQSLREAATWVVAPSPDAGDVRRGVEWLRREQAGARYTTSTWTELYTGSVLFGLDHPYAVPRAGTLQSLEQLRAGGDDALRVRATRFMASHFVPSDSALVIAGDARWTALRAPLEEMFGTWGGSPPPVSAVPQLPRRVRPYIASVDCAGASRALVSVRVVGPPRGAADYDAVRVLASILGRVHGTSRLREVLRETAGDAYSTFASLAPRRFGSTLALEAAVAPESVGRTLRSILAAVRALRAREPDARELDAAREALVNEEFDGDDEIEHVALRWSEAFVFGCAGERDDRIRALRAVSASDVQRAALRYLDPNSVLVVVIGPRAVTESQIEAAGVGPVDTIAHCF